MNLSDRLNPILVREARQAVRNGYVVSGLVLLPCVLAMLTLLNLQLGRATRDEFFQSGKTLFAVLNGIMQPLCILAIPMYIGIRMATERNQAELLFFTGLSPSKVVQGKLSIALVISLLALSLFLPFGLLCHLLRGIDIPTIVGIWHINLLAILCASLWSLFVGCLNMTGPFTKILGYAFMAIGTLIAYLVALGFNFVMLQSGASLLALVFATIGAVCGLIFLYALSIITMNSAMKSPRYATYSPTYAPHSP